MRLLILLSVFCMCDCPVEKRVVNTVCKSNQIDVILFLLIVSVDSIV